jgi:hypothetical protein
MRIREMLVKAGLKRAEIKEKAIFLDGYRIDPETVLEEGAELCIAEVREEGDDPRPDVALYEWIVSLSPGMRGWLLLMGTAGMHDPRFANWSILRVGKEHYLMRRREKE